MQVSKVGELIQVIASVGVLIGLALVFVEIRQNNELVGAELRAVRIVSYEEMSRHEIETDIRTLFQKSIEALDALTDGEILKLDSYLVNIVSLLQQDAALQQAGLSTYRTDDFLNPGAFYFGGRFARAWFELNREWIAYTTPGVADGIARAIETTPVQNRFEYIEMIRERL